MTPHVDILEEQERLARYFWWSIILHISVAASLVGVSWTAAHMSSKVQFGDPNGGRIGAVAVRPVSIPLPSRSGPENPVANPTESKVPEAPPKPKAQQKAVKTPPPDAIPLRNRNVRTRPERVEASQPNKWRAQQQDASNQLHSTGGQALVNPMIGMSGSGGVNLGENTPFGTQFGWYAKALQDKIARNWHTNEIDPRIRNAPVVTISFVILKNGSLGPGSLKISRSSGNRTLDFSALRAIQDSAPLPELPAQFPRNQAEVEFQFELRR
jgi:protein TonB